MKDNTQLKNRICIALILGMTVLFIAVNLYYNLTRLEKIFPMAAFKNQRIYQSSFRDEGMLPDAYIRELIRNKTVLLRSEVYPTKLYMGDTTEEEREENFRQKYFRENNYTRYFEEYARAVEYDPNLADLEEVSWLEDNTDIQKEFTDIGIANDMLRYSFLLNNDNIKESTYFWYSWFYYSFSQEKEWYAHIYVMDGCEDAGSITAVWGKKENIYLMPSEKYAELFGNDILRLRSEADSEE